MPGTTKSAARRMLSSRFEGFSDRFRVKELDSWCWERIRRILYIEFFCEAIDPSDPI